MMEKLSKVAMSGEWSVLPCNFNRQLNLKFKNISANFNASSQVEESRKDCSVLSVSALSSMLWSICEIPLGYFLCASGLEICRISQQKKDVMLSREAMQQFVMEYGEWTLEEVRHCFDHATRQISSEKVMKLQDFARQQVYEKYFNAVAMPSWHGQ
jgi:hypothetical protein